MLMNDLCAPFFVTMGFLDLLKAGAAESQGTSSVINMSSLVARPDSKLSYTSVSGKSV